MAPERRIIYVLDPCLLQQGPQGGQGGAWEGRSLLWDQVHTSVFQDNSWQLYTVQVQTEAISESR